MRASLRRIPLHGPRVALGLLVACGWGSRLPAADESASVEADLQSRFTANSDLAPGGGSISQAYVSLDLSVPVAGWGASGLGVDLIAERQHFNFSNFGGFLPGRVAPLSDAAVLTVQPTLVLAPARDWSLIGSALLQYAGADQAPSGGASLWAGSVGAAEQATPTLKLGLGLEAEQRMRASALILPFPIIDWRLSERWSLTSLDGETARLACSVGASGSVFGQMEFLSQDLRLRRSSSIPSGILRYEAYPLSLGFQWKPRPHLTVAVSAGEALAQSYRFEDSRGRLLRMSGTRSPLIGTLELDCNF